MTKRATKKKPDQASLVERMRAGEAAALSRAITALERLAPAAPDLIAEMAPHLGRAVVVGFTGPPGAGKSTLVSAYVTELRARGRTVGVIAVDPSSPVSGGAILGDRLRMSEHTGDDGVFVRSLAARGHVGGLSPAAVRMIDAFDAAGKDVVILETVGAGQSEIDVAAVADIRVVLNAPGLGDDIQAMKAGILEIADILVVNKADLPEADRRFRHLQSAQSMRAGRAETPLLKCTATTGEGVAELAAEIDRLADSRAADAEQRRRERARRLLAWAASDLIERRITERPRPEVDALCDDILAARLSPEEAALKLLEDL